MVELKEFLSETLKQLFDGIKDAQEYAKEKGGAINPSGLQYLHGSSAVVQHKETSRIGQEVEFDLEIVAGEKKGKKEAIGVLVVGVALGVNREKKDLNYSKNRVSFKIPVIFPKSTYEETK